jgi:hypothetical protein
MALPGIAGRWRHLTHRYITHRLAVRQFRKDRSGHLPNLAMGAIQFLDGWLSKDDRMFEYGAGHSTPWFADRVGELVSVESSAEWHRRVTDFVSAKDNCVVHLIDANDNPTHLAKYEPFSIGWDYARKIHEYPSEYFNCILNDGWIRPLVPHEALNHLRPGGVFLWDDFHSYFPVAGTHLPNAKKDDELLDENRRFMNLVANWRRAVFDDGVHCTAVFFKP